MQVILLEKIQKTGNLGEIVNVKSGFARNFLIPTSKAKTATKANIAEFETIRVELEAKEVASKEKAQRTHERLDGIEITITANASEEGKLFGSIGPNEIVAALDKEFGVEKRNINLTEAIRNLGEYSVIIELWNNIQASITVKVLASTKE